MGRRLVIEDLPAAGDLILRGSGAAGGGAVSSPFLLDVRLKSGARVLTHQLEGGQWQTLALSKGRGHRAERPWKQLAERKATTEEQARADNAAFCAEWGP